MYTNGCDQSLLRSHITINEVLDICHMFSLSMLITHIQSQTQGQQIVLHKFGVIFQNTVEQYDISVSIKNI